MLIDILQCGFEGGLEARLEYREESTRPGDVILVQITRSRVVSLPNPGQLGSFRYVGTNRNLP